MVFCQNSYSPLMTTFLANNKGLVFGFYFAVGEEGDDEDDAKGTHRQQDPEQAGKQTRYFGSWIIHCI